MESHSRNLITEVAISVLGFTKNTLAVLTTNCEWEGWKQEDQLGRFPAIQVRDDGGLDEGGSRRGVGRSG